MSKETSAEVAHLAAQIAPMDKVDMLGALQFGHRLTKADGTKVDFDVAVRSIAASALTQREEDARDPWVPVDEWPTEVDERVLLYVVHPSAEFSETDEERREEWEAICVGYWTDFNGGGWVWHGLAGNVTHVAEIGLKAPNRDA